MSAQTVYNDIDKTMLARFSTLDATGIYAAAYRIIDVSFTPVRSVLNAAYANFFRHGKGGIAVSYSYAKRILPKVMGYSLVIFACSVPDRADYSCGFGKRLLGSGGSTTLAGLAALLQVHALFLG